MAYVYLACAIIFEVLGTAAMKYSEGFHRWIPSVLIVVCYGICYVTLTLALKTLQIGSVYAIWAGVGTVLMAIIGALLFGEPVVPAKVLATSLIIVGVVMLSMNSKPSEKIAEAEAKINKRMPAATAFSTETATDNDVTPPLHAKNSG